VLIESRIVVVNDDFSRDLGVRLGVTTENIGPRPLLVTSGTGTGANNYMASILNSANDPTGTTPIEFPSLSDRYNVNVPIADAAGRFSLALLKSDYLIDLELSALEAEGKLFLHRESLRQTRVRLRSSRVWRFHTSRPRHPAQQPSSSKKLFWSWS